MEVTITRVSAALTRRTLVVADWKADPHTVVAACVGRAEAERASVDLLVPAALHGIDWVGDPYANGRCARRALDELTELLRAVSIDVISARVGDHDPVAATMDVILSHPVDQVVVCGLKRRIELFDLGHRVGRATGRPVLSVPVPPVDRHGRGWMRLRGECATTRRVARASRPVTL